MGFLGKDAMKELSVSNITFRLEGYALGVRERLSVLEKTDFAGRIWRKDPTIWIPDRTKAEKAPELRNRLGWLNACERSAAGIGRLKEAALEIKKEKIKDVVLLGMGGSSLAPYVFASLFGSAKGYPKLTVLDSTHPESVKKVESEIEIEKTLFIVSSKSGTTLETASLFKYFYELVGKKKKNCGDSFVAITDPNTPLDKLALERNFRGLFHGDPETGGRYSALTHFGIFPAALIGVDIERIIKTASLMADEAKRPFPLAENSPCVLGITLGELANAGRNRLVLMLSPKLAPFGAWIEQLIAESTGKSGKGILPIVDETAGSPSTYGKGSLFCQMRLKGDDNDALDGEAEALSNGENPLFRIDLDSINDIGAEFFRWEMATAVAGAVMGINPFDQPDVESAKVRAKEVMKQYEKGGALPKREPAEVEKGLSLYSSGAVPGEDLQSKLIGFLSGAGEEGYVAVMAYLPQSAGMDKALSRLRNEIYKKTKLPVTFGYGPRFLHSTGQLHKGDDCSGLFVQITAESGRDLNIPGEDYSFDTLISAQAEGDYLALADKGRRVIRIHVNSSKGIEGVKSIAGLLE